MLSNGISATLLLLSAIILTIFNGSLAGLFSLIVIIMGMGSLIVLLFPFRYLSVKHILLCFVLFVVFEQFIF